MNLVLKIILVLSITYSYFLVDTRRVYPKEETPKPRRDYRPSKWLTNSALDVWYGNKSMVDIISREFTDVINKITTKHLRSAEYNSRIIWLNSTGNIFKEQTSDMLQRQVVFNCLNAQNSEKSEVHAWDWIGD